MTDGLGLSELEWQPSGNSSSTHDSQTSTDSVGSKPKKSGGGIFGSMSRKIKGIRSTSTSKPAVTRSASSSQRPLPPFSLKQFSSLKKRHGNPCDVSRKAATVRCHGTDRAAVNNIPRRISMGAGAPIKAPQLEIPKDIGGPVTSTCSVEPVDIVFPNAYEVWEHRMLTPEPCEIPSDTAIETIEPSVQPAPERSFEPLPPKPWDPMGMKGVDSQHVPSDTDDHLSVFTDAAGSVVLGEDIKYWSNSTTSTESSHNAANPHDFAVELEGDCVFPSLTPNFLQMAMTQLAFARGTVEPEVRYLERIKRILQKMTLDEFELLVEDVDRDWVPKESLWREFAQFQLRAGIVIGKREIAATMLDRLKLEQGFHKEASGNPVYGILADILEETPCLGKSSSSSSTWVHPGEDTSDDTREDTYDTIEVEESETRGAALKTLAQRAEARKYLKSQKTDVFSVLRTGAHAQAVRTPPMRTWDGQIIYPWQKSEDLDQERSEMSVVKDEEDMKLARMLGHGV